MPSIFVTMCFADVIRTTRQHVYCFSVMAYTYRSLPPFGSTPAIKKKHILVNRRYVLSSRSVTNTVYMMTFLPWPLQKQSCILSSATFPRKPTHMMQLHPTYDYNIAPCNTLHLALSCCKQRIFFSRIEIWRLFSDSIKLLVNEFLLK
jgi:hypothetical protein